MAIIECVPNVSEGRRPEVVTGFVEAIRGVPGVRVLDYGPCSRDNLEWALDPQTSCAAPGCSDPWGGPPIEWTFVDGSEVDPPNFARETLSTMPSCDGAGACSGSSRAVHLGIELATAKNHVHRILEKLGVRRRSDIAARVNPSPDHITLDGVNPGSTVTPKRI